MHVSTPQGGCHFTSGENAITILRAAMAETEKERSGRSELLKSYFDNFDNFDMQWKLSNLALTVHLHTWPDRSHRKVRAQRVLGPGRPDSAVHAVHAQLPMIFCLQVYTVEIIGTMSRLTLVKHQTFLTVSACLNVLNQALEARDFKVKSNSDDSANCNECKEIQAYSKKLKSACFKGDLALISSSFLGEMLVRG